MAKMRLMMRQMPVGWTVYFCLVSQALGQSSVVLRRSGESWGSVWRIIQMAETTQVKL